MSVSPEVWVPSSPRAVRKLVAATVGWRECAETCGRALEKAARGEGLAVLACDAKSGKARLEIVEEYANRLVSVMEMEFEMMDDVEVRARVSEEYGRMKRTLAAYEAKFGRLEA